MIQQGPPTKDFLTDVDRLVRERDELRRELSQFDCRRTGGPVSDVGGVHCPPGFRCMRCQLEGRTLDLALERRRVEALAPLGFDVGRERVRADAAEAALEQRTRDLAETSVLLRHENARALEAERQRDAERRRADAAEATLGKVNADAAEMVDRVRHLAWLASGSPMLGEEPLT